MIAADGPEKRVRLAVTPEQRVRTVIHALAGRGIHKRRRPSAQPGRPVIVLDGDGSLLMQLGGLASIAGLAPPNFYHFVLANGVYETTGRQAVPAADLVDFVALAKAAGYRHAIRFDAIDELRAELPGFLSTPGPVLVVLAIDAEHDHRPVPSNRPADQAGRLRTQLLG